MQSRGDLTPDPLQKPSRDPPGREFSDGNNELTYEPFYDDCNGYENPCIMAN